MHPQSVSEEWKYIFTFGQTSLSSIVQANFFPIFVMNPKILLTDPELAALLSWHTLPLLRHRLLHVPIQFHAADGMWCTHVAVTPEDVSKAHQS